jgi:hypothetical protein
MQREITSEVSEQSASFPVNGLIVVVFALALFGINNLNLIRASFDAPEGWHPIYVARDVDLAQHLTWANASRDRWVIPNFHAAVVTSPGLFSPMMGIVGHVASLGIDAAVVYTGTHLVLYLIGTYALFWCLRIFTTSRTQAYTVLLCMLCVLPVGAFIGLARFILGRTSDTPILPAERDGFVLPGPLGLTVALLPVECRRGCRIGRTASSVRGVCHHRWRGAVLRLPRGTPVA